MTNEGAREAVERIVPGRSHMGSQGQRLAEWATTFGVNLSPLASAPCASHPDRPAVASCTRCGDYVCAACRTDLGTCPRCEARLSRLPWAQRDELGFFRAWLATLKLAFVDPRRYVRAVIAADQRSEAMLFGASCVGVNVLLGMLVFAPAFTLMMHYLPQPEGATRPPPWIGLAVAAFYGVFGELSFLGGSAVWAGVLRLSSRLFGLRTSFRTLWCLVFYAAAPLVLAWIPLAGLLAPAYGVVLTVMGVHEQAEQRSLVRATLSVVAPVALFLFIVVAGYVAIFVFAMTRIREAQGS